MQELSIFYILFSYLIGAIPFGLLWGRLAGVDVRRSGSGNIGATNVGRLVGRKIGLLALVSDIAKGLLPMLSVAWLGADQAVVLICGLASFMGHLYPVYLGFKGGKGVATALGVYLYFDPLAIFICMIIFGLVVARSGYVSAGSLTASALMPVLIFLFHGAGNLVWASLAVAGLIWFKHGTNISRLLKGEEKSWRKGKDRNNEQ